MKTYTAKNYIEYMKDNPNKLWFKQRLYGWGWVPVSWQGWTTVLIFIMLILANGAYLEYTVRQGVPTTNDFIIFYSVIIAAIAAIIAIGFKKGEKPNWNWGLIKN